MTRSILMINQNCKQIWKWPNCSFKHVVCGNVYIYISLMTVFSWKMKLFLNNCFNDFIPTYRKYKSNSKATSSQYPFWWHVQTMWSYRCVKQCDQSCSQKVYIPTSQKNVIYFMIELFFKQRWSVISLNHTGFNIHRQRKK